MPKEWSEDTNASFLYCFSCLLRSKWITYLELDVVAVWGFYIIWHLGILQQFANKGLHLFRLWKASKFRLWKERSSFVKIWCLVGGYVVPTPSLFIKTSRRDIISRWKKILLLLSFFSHSFILLYAHKIHVILNLLHWCGSKKQMHKFIFSDTLSSNSNF